MLVSDIRAEKILDSRGEPSILVSVETKKGKVQASSPSGKSRGKYEASPFSSRGVDFSISFINVIGRKIVGEKISLKEFSDLEKIERMIREFDKSENWNVIGGNALFALEAALLKAMAMDSGVELWQFLNPSAKSIPLPLGNCIGGGAHSKKEGHPDMQEFLIMPKTKTFYDAYFINLQTYRVAKGLVDEKDNTWEGDITDEKALCPNLTTESILDLLKEAGEKINSRYKTIPNVGMDVAASTMWHEGRYNYKNPEKKTNSDQQLKYLKNLIEKYGLFYIEDPFNEDDFGSFAELLSQVDRKKVLICGDDLTATQPKRLEIAIRKKAVNAVIVKPNQNGSLIETKKFVDMAKVNGIATIISHRSGETSDSAIADLAVAWGIPMIKTGIIGRERLAKLHRLLRIEREIRK